MANKSRYTRDLYELDVVKVFSHFTWFVTAHDFTSLAADAGTSAAVSDAVNGVLALGTAATDNNEAAVRSTTELFKVGDDREIYGRCRLQFTEANTDDANVFFGFASAIGANLLVDDGAGPRTTGDVIGIYKVDGGTVWRCVSQINGGTPTITASTTTAGGSSYQDLEVIIEDIGDGSNMRVLFKVDGQYLTDSNRNKIVHTVSHTNATDMHVGAYVKAGGANAETLNVDSLYADQNRV